MQQQFVWEELLESELLSEPLEHPQDGQEQQDVLPLEPELPPAVSSAALEQPQTVSTGHPPIFSRVCRFPCTAREFCRQPRRQFRQQDISVSSFHEVRKRKSFAGSSYERTALPVRGKKTAAFLPKAPPKGSFFYSPAHPLRDRSTRPSGVKAAPSSSSIIR